MLRRFIGIALVTAALAGCGQQGAQQKMPPPVVGFVVIKTQPISLTAELAGRTDPFAVSQVVPQVAGIIKQRLFTEGSLVAAGQALYQIDPAPYQATYDSAMATLADKQQYLRAFGRRHTEKIAPMTADTVFWIASFTKLVTSVVALQMVEEGVISLEQPVASVRPDFADLAILDGFDPTGAPRLRQAKDAPTIRHLLTHTSGLGYAFMDADLARYAELKKVAPGGGHLLPRRFEAGVRWQYGASTDWLGMVIEGVTGQGLDAVFQRRIFDRLGMTDTTFVPDAAQKARSAAMHARLPDGDAAPIDFALAPPPNPNLGGGGLYSTASDFMRLLRALLDGKILGDASRAALFENQVGDLEAGVLASSMPSFTNPYDAMPGRPKRWSLGMLINPEPGPDGRAAGSAAWAGLANCYYWVDPSRGLAAIILAQVLPFADRKVLGLFSAFERAIYA